MLLISSLFVMLCRPKDVEYSSARAARAGHRGGVPALLLCIRWPVGRNNLITLL